MEKKELEMQVAKVVEDLFNEKEEAEIRRKTEEELRKAAASISELTAALETKNGEIAEYEKMVSENEATTQTLNTELEAARSELTVIAMKLADSEKEIDSMRKDKAAESRMKELELAGVVSSNKDYQVSKIKEMTDEEFATYKNELVAIRENVIAELEKSRVKAEAEAKAADEEAARKAKEIEDNKTKDLAGAEKDNTTTKEEDSDNASTNVAEGVADPAQITAGHAAMASLNMECLPDEGLKAKYKKLGEEMAKRWKKSE